VIVADDQLETPHYEVTRIRENELGEETSKPSYQRGTPRKLATPRADQGAPQHPEPARRHQCASGSAGADPRGGARGSRTRACRRAGVDGVDRSPPMADSPVG
jgi:hypothetical protein